MRISVIVPVFNSEKTIGKCLDSLLNQAFPREDYEVIIVDDGSTDSTAQILKGYSVKVITQTNRGPATARNVGAEEAKGEILLFTDADCVPSENWVEEMLKPFHDEEVKAVKGAYKTRQKSMVARFSQLEFEERFELLKKAPSIDMVDTYSAGYRKKGFIHMKGFDTSFPVANNEDTELSYRMSSQGHKMVFNPNAIVYHLGHSESLKKYAVLKFWRGYWRMVVYKRFPDKMIKDSYTPQTLKLQILFLFLSAACLPLAFLFPPYGKYPFYLMSLFFIFSTFPFTLAVIKKDLLVGIFSPIFLLVRAASIGLGALVGMIGTASVSASR